jgi:SynChlorMet cassette protein ScmD
MNIDRPKAASHIVYREEFDDRIMLFNPDTGRTVGLNSLGVLIWQFLDGHRQIDDIVNEIKNEFQDVPDDVKAHVEEFVANLCEKGMAIDQNPEARQ